MANWSPVSGTTLHYIKTASAGGGPGSGYFIKFYNTSNVAISMASAADGSGLLAKAQIDSSGYPLNGSAARFIPFIDRDYRPALYRNAADADGDIIANADWFPGTTPKGLTSQEAAITKSSLAEAKADDGLAESVGETVTLLERNSGTGGGGVWDIVTGLTANGLNIVNFDNVPAVQLRLRFAFTVNISQIYDDAASIPTFLPILAALPLFGVLVVDRQFISDPFVIPDWVTVKGPRKEDGWTRVADFKTPFKITLSDNSNAPLVTVEDSTVNWGLENVTLDGNKDNQTSFSSHCIKTKTATFRNFGGIVSGVKCLNAKGWGAFFTGGPLNITDSFFMSGAAFVDCSDLKIANVDLDGTDGLHPAALWSRSTSAEAMTNIFCFGNGESVATPEQQTESITVDSSSNFTLTPTFLYEDAPVRISGIQPTTANAFGIYFAHDAGTHWSLHLKPFAHVSGNAKVLLASTGAATLHHGGNEGAAYVSHCTRLGWSGIRWAGAKKQGFTGVEMSSCYMTNLAMWNNNLQNAAATAALELVDSSSNSFSNGRCGETGSLITNSVALSETRPSGCFDNIFDESLNLEGTATAIQFLDDSTPKYDRRNRFYPRLRDTDGKNYTSATKDREPGFLMADFKITSDTAIPATTNTTLPLTLTDANGITLTGGNTLVIPVTPGGLYKISLTVTLDAFPSDMLYQIAGLSAVHAVNAVRKYTNDRTTELEFEFRSATEQDISVTFIAFSGSGAFTANSDAGFSYGHVEKTGDSSV